MADDTEPTGGRCPLDFCVPRTVLPPTVPTLLVTDRQFHISRSAVSLQFHSSSSHRFVVVVIILICSFLACVAAASIADPITHSSFFYLRLLYSRFLACSVSVYVFALRAWKLRSTVDVCSLCSLSRHHAASRYYTSSFAGVAWSMLSQRFCFVAVSQKCRRAHCSTLDFSSVFISCFFEHVLALLSPLLLLARSSRHRLALQATACLF